MFLHILPAVHCWRGKGCSKKLCVGTALYEISMAIINGVSAGPKFANKPGGADAEDAMRRKVVSPVIQIKRTQDGPSPLPWCASNV